MRRGRAWRQSQDACPLITAPLGSYLAERESGRWAEARRGKKIATASIE
jgi:hypothetical protein